MYIYAFLIAFREKLSLAIFRNLPHNEFVALLIAPFVAFSCVREDFMPVITLCILLGYLLIINIIAFALMGTDKKKAQTKAWRIPEKTLFLSAILGGSIGAIVGMQVFRHKTKHWYFKYGMPAILILQILAASVFWYIIWYPAYKPF